ncbi:MAG: hypothetical protein LCH81_17410 [Bacteroidetes bacterium]|nr:hypothetical protein [Bacteroidota bacterium]
MLCPNCGQTARPESARCGHCNYKLPECPSPSAGPAPTTLPCWNCAQPNPSDAERCSCCNAKVAARVGKPHNGRSILFTQTAVKHDQ